MDNPVSKSKKETLASTRIIHVEIDIRSEFWQELKTICEHYGWDTKDGLPVLLAIGLSAVQTPRKDRSNEENREHIDGETRISSEVKQDKSYDIS